MLLRRFGYAILLLLALLPLRSHAQDTKENVEFKLAVGLYNDGLYAQAEDQFRGFVDKFPAASLGIEARFYLGLIQLKLKKYAAARATFQDFAVRYPDHPRSAEAWWNLGDACAAERNWGEAASAYSRLKTFHPKDKRAPDALLLASRCFARAGDQENARLVLNSILTEYPQSDAVQEATLSLAELLIDAGDYDRALQELTRVRSSSVAKDELKGRAVVGIGRVHALLGNRAEAKTQFLEAVTRFAKTPAVFDAQLGLGDLARQFHAYDEALDSYARITANAAAPAEVRRRAFAGAASAARDAGRTKDAARQYDSLFAAFPGERLDAELLLTAAEAARAAGDFTSSLRRLRLVTDDSSASAWHREALVQIGRVAAEAHRPDEALQAYHAYVTRFPNDDGAPSALLAIGDITGTAFGNPTRAAEIYAEVLDRYGNSAVADQAQYAQAHAFESAGRHQAAADAYMQVIRQYPASALVARARKEHDDIVRFRRGGADDALPAITAALSALAEKGAQAQVDLALATIHLDHLKDPARALKHFSAAIAAGLPSGDAERAAYGRAVASLRLVQKGEGSPTEAEQYLIECVRTATGSIRDEAAFDLFTLRSENKPPADVVQAAASFRASGVTAHSGEVEIAAIEALQSLGRHGSADSLCTSFINGRPGTSVALEATALRGISRAALQNFRGAAEDFRTYEREAPSGARAASALMAQGALLARTGQYSEAADAWDMLAERFPYSPLADSARISACNALADGRMTERAVVLATEFHTKADANPFVSDEMKAQYLYELAVVRARAKDQTGAKRTLQLYLARYPNGRNVGDVYYALGQIFKGEGKIPLATSYLQQAGMLNKSVQARIDAADLLLSSGRFDEAATAFSSIADDTPGRIERSYAHSRAVVALYRAEKVQEAASAAEKFKSAYPDATPVFEEFEIERAKVFFRQKQYKKASDILDDITDSKTPSVAGMALYWLGRSEEAQNRNQQAEEKWTAVTEKYPGTEASLEARLSLARLAFRGEKFDVAALAYKAVVDDPVASQDMLKQALNGLISCYDELKLYDAAAEMTKRFLDTWPNDATAFRKRVNLGVFYYQLRYFDQAITHFESLFSQATPEDQAEIRYYIGESYFYKGDFTQAVNEFLKVTLVTGKTEIDWTASSYYMAGQSYEKMGKYPLALDMYDKIVTTPGLDSRFKAQAEKEAARVRALLR